MKSDKLLDIINNLHLVYSSVERTSNPKLLIAKDINGQYLLDHQGNILLSIKHHAGWCNVYNDIVEVMDKPGLIIILRLINKDNKLELREILKCNHNQSIGKWEIITRREKLVIDVAFRVNRVFSRAIALNVGYANFEKIYTKAGVSHNDEPYLRIIKAKNNQALIGVKHLYTPTDSNNRFRATPIREIHILSQIGEIKQKAYNDEWDKKYAEVYGYTLTGLYSRSLDYVNCIGGT